MSQLGDELYDRYGTEGRLMALRHFPRRPPPSSQTDREAAERQGENFDQPKRM